MAKNTGNEFRRGASGHGAKTLVGENDLQAAAPAVAAHWGGGRLTFARPEYGVAPGQSAVFYDGERLLGGGTIVATVAATLAEAVPA